MYYAITFSAIISGFERIHAFDSEEDRDSFVSEFNSEDDGSRMYASPLSEEEAEDYI